MEVLARTCKTERMNGQRILARTFVVLGGIMWAVLMISPTAYGQPLSRILPYALIVIAGIAAVFIIGMYYERVAALILTIAAIGVLAWGVVVGWEPVVWGVVLLLFVAPMLIAAGLYVLAARMQAICSA